MKKVKIPLNKNTIGKDERKALLKVFDSGYMTMGKITKKFESVFAKYIGSKHAIYVNSGSSANLLAFSAIQDNDKLIKPKINKKFISQGDEIIVPAVSWSTSIWPICQIGATPVFVDSEPTTLQMKIDSVKKAITKKTKAICVVHVLGNAGYIKEIKKKFVTIKIYG